jgi:MoaA/NifB/PqqE/SkfB family radical SAM enzyme
MKQHGLGRFVRHLLRHPFKLINLARVAASFLLARGKIWGVPPVLILEPTTHCQLKCPLCVQEDGAFKRRDQHMSLGAVKTLLAECGRFVSMALLYNQGEPFLHPQVLEIIRLLKSHAVFVKISTNGNYRKDIAEDLVASGCDHIIFSIDGDTQEVYEKYRKGGDLERVLENMRRIVKARASARSRTPFLEARLVLMAHNEGRVRKVRDLAMALGIDAFSVKKCIHRDPAHFKESGVFMPSAYARKKGAGVPVSCYLPWVYFCVLVDGQISPCCYDEFGSLKEESLKDILNKPAFIQWRSMVKSNPSRVALCQDCDIADDFYLTWQEAERQNIS